ncbi:YcxB family protein [Mucilaginibacter lutimaris]|uniref:YcxB family protein n=1 Tax=Mucilaginibacter lutimaris TaxID=931629 RepID=A0ABW2ZE07_9SPHI
MVVKTHITLQQYIKLMYFLTYRKGGTIYISIIAVIMFVTGILSVAGISDMQTDPTFALVFGAFVIFVLPVSVYLSAKKNFNSNKRLSETIDYEFTSDKMIVRGETFHSELGLNETFKIEELKNWFLIYQSKQTANFVSKASLNTVEISELRSLFNSLSGVKVKLKRK